MSTRLMTVAEVADQLGLTAYQIRAEHARGLLPGRRPGRFLRFAEADLDTYLARIAEDRGGAASGQTARSRAATLSRRSPR